MTTDTASDTTSSPEALPEGETSPMLYGSGQAFWLAVVTVVAFAALVLAGIAVAMAGGDDDGGGGGGTAAPAPSEGTLAVAGGEFFFDPSEMSVLAGEEVSVEFTNDGSIEHNWTALNAGTTISSESDFEESMVLVASDDVAGGESTTTAATFDAGEYQIICTIPGHLDGGMEGTLTAA